MTMVFKTNPKVHVKIMTIAAQMKKSGLPDELVSASARLAQEYEGAYDLMVLWFQASNEEEKNETIADIQDEIDSHQGTAKNSRRKALCEF